MLRLPDHWASGGGRPTPSILSSLLDICRDTKRHDYRRHRLIGDSVLLTILVLIFGRSDLFVWILGFFSLGLESTLPLPQFVRLVMFLLNALFPTYPRLSNYKQRSLYGFRMSTLIGWVGGDSFKYGRISIHFSFHRLKNV